MRQTVSFKISDISAFKRQLLEWIAIIPKFCILDSNNWNGNQNELIAAIGAIEELAPLNDSFKSLKNFHTEKKDWLFGHLAYDLKNETETLSSKNFDGIGIENMHFFQPEYVLTLRDNTLKIEFLPEFSSEEKVKELFQRIVNLPHPASVTPPQVSVRSRTSESEYLLDVKTIKWHISIGDIYEVNYCMDFFSENAEVDPCDLFRKLSDASQTPFSAFYRLDDKCLMCASPERYLKKTGNKIISQPIKGTAKRGNSGTEDLEIKKMFSQNKKEKSENVMIVDLVRNDLSRTCSNVKVDELFGIYTFKQWHQMISTVSGELREGVHFTDVIKNSFPMGSMTGAPKVRAMELIERFEKTKRGLYSGAVGYITPEGDFDFNVVIRSILYNSSKKYLSFQVGSAITVNSTPENEYAECLLKAKAMFEVLGASPIQLSGGNRPQMERAD